MSNSAGVLELPALNQWALFRWIVIAQAAAMIVLMVSRDLATAEGVSAMIQSSVRWSVPLLFLAFAASSLPLLFPGDITRWIQRNRRILGVAFAVGMTWQVSFILWLVTVHRDYYVEEVYVLRDVIEGLIGYLFLILMTVTSFKPGRQWLTPKANQWKRLHTIGIYFLWAYAFGTYWYAVFYYENPDMIHYLFYAMAVAALGARIAAWVKKQHRSLDKSAAPKLQQPTLRGIGRLVILLGVIGAATGSLWEAPAHEHLYGFGWAQFLELYVPYWPFVPYLPMIAIALGAYLVVYARRVISD